jgi:ABC-type transport system involved in multi-copper enzyme maturation permease subunit
VTPLLLIAGNFLREQRWVLLLLLALVLGNGTLFSLVQHDPVDELATFVRLQAAYGVALGVFLVAPAMHNERRSRRILSVLSKAVSRRQYLAGLLAGAAAAVAVYALAIAAAATLLFRGVASDASALWVALLLMMAAAVLGAGVTLAFAILMPPLFATAAAVLLVMVPAVLAHGFAAPGWLNVLPVAALVLNILQWSPEGTWQPAWTALLFALPQAALVWLAAAQLFAARDIAVAVE